MCLDVHNRHMLRARCGTSARTSFSSTNDHPAPFVKRPALAPMYTALGLTSLDLVISNRKLRWAGHVRRMDWSRLPRKFLTPMYTVSGRLHAGQQEDDVGVWAQGRMADAVAQGEDELDFPEDVVRRDHNRQ
jgi:hypothetical protein